MSNRIRYSVKVFTGEEIVPFSSVYNDKAISELGLLPSYINDFIKTSMYRYIHGFEILEHRIINNNFIIRLSPGCCLLNKSVVFIKTETNLVLRIDQEWLNYDGYIVSDLYYDSINKSYNMSIYFVRDDGEIFPSYVDFNPDDEHIIVALIKLIVFNQNVASIDVTKRNIRNGIRIKSKTFYVYGYYPAYVVNTNDVIDDIGEYISSIFSSEFINVVRLDDHTVRLELVNTDNIPINFDPESYSISDNRIVSHLAGIDNELKYSRINVDTFIITDSIYNSGLYINTSKNIDYSKFDRSVMFVKNGITLMPNEDYIYHNSNTIRIINQHIMIGDVITLYYYYTN
ncbi:MAG: hypothetical protein QXD03_02345 [Candidatus Anstonellales archaeon]